VSIRPDIQRWHSEHLGLDMPIARFGHGGRAFLIFPTWASDFLESERQGLIDAVSDLIEGGRVTVFCIDSISPLAWCDESVPIPEKVRRQALHSLYVEDEVVPHIRASIGDRAARIGVGGASFGAFFAANALFRRPDLFGALLGMSGFYDLAGKLRGFDGGEAYFNNPTWFVPNLPDGPALDALRADTRIELMTGQGAHEAPEESVRFARTLEAKGIPHRLDLWGPEMAHDWPTWRRMIRIGLEERFGW
jgi:esterase/lipase superfamily enzyme